MGSHLLKVSRYRSHDNKKSKDGRIELENNHIGFLHEISLVEKPPKIEVPSRKHRVSESASADWLLNSEFVSPSLTSPMPDTLSLNAQKIDSTPSMSLVEFSMPERVFNQERFAECKIDLDQLFHRLKTKQALKIVKSNDNRTNLLSDFNFSGNLVAHLHEHRNAVTRMTTLKSNGSLFASTSTDGTVRLWDCSKLDGHQNINKSRQSYSANTPLNAIAACDAGQSLAVAGRDGALLVLRIDSNSSKMALQQARHLDSNTRIDRTVKENDDGPVVEMQAMDQGSQSLVVYATLYGAIVGWDIRMPGNAWRLESDLRNGVITSFTIDPTNSSWLALGTSSGRHLAWDLRFRLKIAEIKHPHEARIRRVACHPTEPSCLISASQGNNEVFSWNIETSSRQLALWASPAPPLSNINNSTHSVCALLPGVVDGRGFLITGGTDQRIRFWDLQDASNCKLVVPAPKDFPSASISYE
jgi:phosphoinositide-3-kinase, regulatory subunit 4